MTMTATTIIMGIRKVPVITSLLKEKGGTSETIKLQINHKQLRDTAIYHASI